MGGAKRAVRSRFMAPGQRNILLLLLEIYSAITLGLYTFQARKDSSSYLGDPIAHGVLCIRLQS